MRCGRSSSIFKGKAEKSERGNMTEGNLRAPTEKKWPMKREKIMKSTTTKEKCNKIKTQSHFNSKHG